MMVLVYYFVDTDTNILSASVFNVHYLPTFILSLGEKYIIFSGSVDG